MSAIDTAGFDSWFDGYCVRFNAVAKQVASDDTVATDFFHHLSRFSVGELSDATSEIMGSDSQPYPSEHLGRIKSICERNRMKIKPPSKKVVDYRQPETFSCQVCHDMGCLWVFHPMAYRPIQLGNFNPRKHLTDIVVGCSCPAGQQFINKEPPKENDRTKHIPSMLRFNENKMLPTRDWERNRDRDETDLIEFVNSYQHPNHNSEFDNYAKT